MEQPKTTEELLAVDIELCNEQELSDLLTQLEKAREPLVQEYSMQFSDPKTLKLPMYDMMSEENQKRLNTLDNKIAIVKDLLSSLDTQSEKKE